MELNIVTSSTPVPSSTGGKRVKSGFKASKRKRREFIRASAKKLYEETEKAQDFQSFAESHSKSDEESNEVNDEHKPKAKYEFIKHAVQLDSELFNYNAESFSELGVNSNLCEELEKQLSITKPTLIQSRCVKFLCEKSDDAMINSVTGSGKTLCYLLPILSKLLNNPEKLSRDDGTQVLIVVPTRELCIQVEETLKLLLHRFYWIISSVIMGGEKKKSEKARLRKGVTILTATPGRLLDHMQNTKCFDVSRLKYLVIDEADRLLDLGFENDIYQIFQLLNHRAADPKKRFQRIMASATIAKKVDGLACQILEKPVFISATDEDDENQEESRDDTQFDMPEHLEQGFIRVREDQKFHALISFLKWKSTRDESQSENRALKAIVFMMACKEVEFYHNILSRCDIFNPADIFCLHGKMSQLDRSQTFINFCKAESGVLLATSIASRGLDLPHVDWIIQYDPPEDISEYIHRVGRTARIGNKGRAILFLYPSEFGFKEMLERKQSVSFREINTDSLLHSTVIHESKDDIQILTSSLMHYVGNNRDIQELARVAFLSIVRGYATFPKSVKHIFHVRKLHLGQLAASFFLKENPIQISNKVRRFGNEESFSVPKRQRIEKKPKGLMKISVDTMNEFAAM